VEVPSAPSWTAAEWRAHVHLQSTCKINEIQHQTELLPTVCGRLIGPAYDYIPVFQTALLRLRLAVAGANLVTEDAHASFQAVAPQLLTQANAAGTS
jgi:hypothetical protein